MAQQAVDADVHVVGVSSLAGGHKTLVPRVRLSTTLSICNSQLSMNAVYVKLLARTTLKLLLFAGTNCSDFKVPCVWRVLILAIFAVCKHS